MSRWLPSPATSLGLLALWLLLNQSVSPGHLLLGAILGLLGPLILRRLEAPPLKLARPDAILRLLCAFGADMVRSNLKVARTILRDDPGRTPGFTRIPLRLRSPYGLAALACIITATPGTSWVSYDPATGILVIHVLDLSEGDDWSALIGWRYERLLLEIFE
ncbi:Na+/H+ antiporter subunit E [Bosea sp. (in: a-proteobacteria)]|uniref:Na+/H+ antiporter subunit E n=1 Tax=Bosea sp. (in: a-proteobacteria) TaxID=1871050 RepID=UPI002FCA107B